MISHCGGMKPSLIMLIYLSIPSYSIHGMHLCMDCIFHSLQRPDAALVL